MVSDCARRVDSAVCVAYYLRVLEPLTQQLRQSAPLAREQVAAAVGALVDENVSVPCKADLLTALALKGETIEEIAAFARELRDKSIRPPFTSESVDVCGTGGDHLKTFNISTTVALIVAAAGIPVAKHGNRAITSQAGSADVLEALGIRIDLTPEQAANALREHHFAFFFAPKYHPAFKHIAPARKLCAERGQRTIFNFLGPLLNPARPTAQLIGVPKPGLCEPMARVLQSLGVRRGMVVSGCVGGDCFLDELSTLGETTVAEFYQDRGFSKSTFKQPDSNGTLADLAGGDSKANAEIIRRILSGDDKGPKREAVLLNAGAALLVAGRAKSIAQGADLAAEVIDSGAAMKKLEVLKQYGATAGIS
jgi:anthranilate phosphoribosyltransferase